jgi:hypothetical protein
MNKLCLFDIVKVVIFFHLTKGISLFFQAKRLKNKDLTFAHEIIFVNKKASLWPHGLDWQEQ